MTNFVKSVVTNNAVALRAYDAYQYWRGKRLLAAGKHFSALDCFCQAYRRIPNASWVAKHSKAISQTMHQACFVDGKLAPISQNRFLMEYPDLPLTIKKRKELVARPLEDRIRLRQPKSGQDPRRQGSLIILKHPDPATGERGAILLKYLYSFSEMPALFDLRSLATQYQIVLEPSWTGYVEAPFFLYIGCDADVVIQCTQPSDAAFFENLGVNFRTVTMGGGDWVDDELFAPTPGTSRDYDIAMVASWLPWKRHEALFAALSRLAPRKFSVALIGSGDAHGRQVLERQMRKYGVRDQCEVFEKIPPEQVASLLARAKVALLLSKLEGTNKGIHEALFCDTPIVVYRHHVGLNMSTVNEMTGALADDHELPEVLTRIIDGPNRFQPRQWALAHTGFRRSTETINQMLKEMAFARGLPWTQDLVYKTNRPHAQYMYEEDRLAFASAYEPLKQWFIR